VKTVAVNSSCYTARADSAASEKISLNGRTESRQARNSKRAEALLQPAQTAGEIKPD